MRGSNDSVVYNNGQVCLATGELVNVRYHRLVKHGGGFVWTPAVVGPVICKINNDDEPCFVVLQRKLVLSAGGLFRGLPRQPCFNPVFVDEGPS